MQHNNQTNQSYEPSIHQSLYLHKAMCGLQVTQETKPQQNGINELQEA